MNDVNPVAEAIGNDPKLLAEFVEKMGAVLPTAATAGAGLESAGPGAAESIAGAIGIHPGLEAIVERFGRPSLIIFGDTFEIPESDEWKARLLQHSDKIAAAIKSVGRVEIKFHSVPYGGTAWMVAPNVAVTNRHVAKLFANRRNGVFPLGVNTNGQTYEPRVDFLEEADNPKAREFSVVEVLFVADDGEDQPDLAFLRLEAADGQPLPAPIKLSADPRVRSGQMVVTIGYPAFDFRQDNADQDRIFGGVYNVKRIAPGNVKMGGGAAEFTHDCTTLGGNSGSIVLNPESGEAVGLHFAGRRGIANYAVTSAVVKSYFDRFVGGGEGSTMKVSVVEAEVEAPATPTQLATRGGYDPGFLGDGFQVEMPRLMDDVALAIPDSPRPNELLYHHYSVVMHKERRMAAFTAANLDGTLAKPVKRGTDKWYFDPRVGEEHQLGNALYSSNPLDRGHLVRRLDPAWGATQEEAIQGVEDTFYWTNCSPQHANLNRKTWVSLENYILENSNTRGFKACVFTGPVFDDEDPEYRGMTRLPQAFWKVAVMVKEDDESEAPRLSSTGYVLSQADLITELEFTFGAFKTFQVPIQRIKRLARLDFGEAIESADRLATLEAPPSYIELEEESDIVL